MSSKEKLFNLLTKDVKDIFGGILNNLKALVKLEDKALYKKTKKFMKSTGDKIQPVVDKVKEPVKKKVKNILSGIFGFFKTLVGYVIGYKVFEWFSKDKNKKKIKSILDFLKVLSDFIINVADSLVKITMGGIDILMKSGEMFTNWVNNIFNVVKSIIDLPNTLKNDAVIRSIESIQNDFNKSVENVGNNLVENIDKSVENIKLESTENSDDKKPDYQPVEETNLDSIKSIKVDKPSIPTQESPNVTIKPDKDLFKNPTVDQTPPKLALGGKVETSGNIIPLNKAFSNNDGLKNNVTDLLPKFADLIVLPFKVISSGIASLLQNVIKDDNQLNSVVQPILNSLNSYLGIKNTDISDSSVFNVKSNDGNLNNVQSDNTDKLLNFIGLKDPTINESNNSGNGDFNKQNDDSIRGILADILNILIKKNGGKPDNVLPKMSGGGWISGSHKGYPVTLDGKTPSFEGHGTEYVSKHKFNNNSFVIPYDTPDTKRNPGLTKKRIKEAVLGNYDVSGLTGYSKGGSVKSKPKPKSKSKDPTKGLNLVWLKTKNNLHYQVAKPLAERFKGFVDELESTGYVIKNIGGYRYRENEMNGLYAHPFGAAIDINYNDNPMQKTLKTNLPPNISTIAKKYGLGWGGNWKSIKDAMHFSAMIREGGTGYNGKEISTSVLSEPYNKELNSITNNVVEPPFSKEQPTTVTPNQQVNNVTQQQQQQPVNNFDIGKALQSLLQMLGVGEKENKNNITSPTNSNNNNVKSNDIPVDADEQIKDSNSVIPKKVPNVTPLPNIKNDVKKIDKKHKKSKNNIKVDSVNKNNNISANKTLYPMAFEFNSDLSRFSVLNASNDVLGVFGV